MRLTLRTLAAVLLMPAASMAAAEPNHTPASIPVPAFPGASRLDLDAAADRAMDRLSAASDRSDAFSRGSDPLWNGTLIGAAIGVGFGFGVAPPAFCGSNDAECSAIVRVYIGLPSIAAGAAVGALVDWAIRPAASRSDRFARDRQVLVAPTITSRSRSVHVAVRF